MEDNMKTELPWAYPKKDLRDFTGPKSGLYFHFFRTYDEAVKSRKVYLRHGGKDYGSVRFLPDECFQI
jgi:hypothetical protein